MNVKIYRLAGIPLLAFLSGCIPLSHKEYEDFGRYLVPLETDLIRAITLLHEEGYNCSTHTPYHSKKVEPSNLMIYCHRKRPGFLYACAQSIDLDIDEKTWRVISNTPESACTGL